MIERSFLFLATIKENSNMKQSKMKKEKIEVQHEMYRVQVRV